MGKGKWRDQPPETEAAEEKGGNEERVIGEREKRES